jgi:hypothetical protein
MAAFALTAARAATLPGETKIFTPPAAASVALYNRSMQPVHYMLQSHRQLYHCRVVCFGH